MKNRYPLRAIARFTPSFLFFAFSVLEAPVLKNIESSPINYTTGSGSAIVSKSIDIADKDNRIQSATIKITDGFTSGEDVLSLAAFDGISSDWDNSSGTLSLTGEAKVSEYKKALRNVRYTNDNTSDPVTVNREITFTVNDGTDNSNSLSRTLSISDPTPDPDPAPADTVPDPSPTPDPTPVDTVPDPPTPDPTPVDTVPDPPTPDPTPVDTVPDPEPTPDPTPTDTVPEPDPTPVDTVPDPNPEPSAPKPEASISGSKTICQGQTTQLTITFKGAPPFDVVVLRDNSTFRELDNIQTLTYTLEVNSAGTYTLSDLQDSKKDGNTSGTATVTSYSLPTANISGDKSLCGGGETELPVKLTGNAPWRFTYRLNSETPVLVQDVTSADGKIKVSKAGTYTLTEVYDKNCKGSVSGKAQVQFTSPPEVEISGLGDSYSNTTSDWVQISGNPSGGEFSGSGILRYQNKWFFLPSLAPVGNNRIVYKYRSSPEACYGYDTANVRIFESTAEIVFDNERTTFCSNEGPFTVKGQSLTSSSSGRFEITGGAGLTDNGNNTAVIDPSALSEGKHTITFTAGDGISVDREIEIGQPLKAGFTWETECFTPGASISFVNSTSSPFGFTDDESFVWKIYSQNDSVLLTTKNISYNFPEPGNYVVELRARNSNGCYDTASKVIPLRPIVKLAGQNYFETFEEESSWYSAHDSGPNSWVLETPQEHGFPSHGFKNAYSGEKSWFTDIIQSPVPEEKSWITSPCFDFTGTGKPTFVSQVWRLFTDNRDGASLEYTTDNGANWYPVGTMEDGINWYTGYYGDPGEQSIGWTAVYDTGWVEVRHELDFLNGEPEVQFRFAYTASGSAIGNDGIAVDNIKIVERNRTVLMEHFTNSSSGTSVMADSILNVVADKAGSNVIDLQYHTDQPGNDPLNADNPVVPGARQFYYGVSSVPYTIINGGLHGNQRIDYETNSLDDDRLSVESLYDSDFNLGVTTMIENDTLYVEAAVTSLFNTPLSELAVRIAVIEDVEDPSGSGRIFRNVVKTIIPDAVGEIMYRAWTEGETQYVRHKWPLENVYDPANIHAVAFIQNEQSKEVLQAAADERGVVTGNDDLPQTDGKGIIVFPNPARKIAWVNFNNTLKDDIRLDLVNNLGQTVLSSMVAAGTTTYEIPVSGLATGIYIIRLSGQDGMIENLKLMISD